MKFDFFKRRIFSVHCKVSGVSKIVAVEYTDEPTKEHAKILVANSLNTLLASVEVIKIEPK